MVKEGSKFGRAKRVVGSDKTKTVKTLPLPCYHGISDNIQAVRRFYYLTSKLAYKWINKRSQKKSFTYKHYCYFKEYNPFFPEFKIYYLPMPYTRIRELLVKSHVRGNLKYGSLRGVEYPL